MNAKSRKTIMLVGMKWDYCDESRGPSADARITLPALETIGYSVTPFWFDGYVQRNALAELQVDILRSADEIAPDAIVFLTYTDQFDLKTLDALRSRFRTCAWFGDDHWRFDSYTRQMAAHYQYCVTTDYFAVPRYQALSIHPIVSQWAAATPLEETRPLQGPDVFQWEVSFVGQSCPYRKWFVDKLNEMSIRVECFGRGWPNGPVSDSEMGRVFNKSRINLNISNSVQNDIRFIRSGLRPMVNWLRSPKTVEQIKSRNFEIPSAGGFQLTNYVPGLEHYLTIGREVAVYSGVDDCVLQIRRYLDNEQERICMANRGYSRARRYHRWEQRWEKILNIVLGQE